MYFSVVIPHLFHVKQVETVRNRLKTAKIGGMIEDYTANADELLPYCDFAFVGTNDLLRLDADLSRIARRVAEIAQICARYRKRLTICGNLCENAHFRQICAENGVFGAKKNECFT